MDWSPILAELPKAVPYTIGALVGGLVGGLSGVTVQYFTHLFTRRREAAKLLREKAEDLISTLDQFQDWATAWRPTDHQTPSPLNRASVLQQLYFPQLAPHFETIREAAIPVFPLLARMRGQPAELTGMGLQPLSMQEKEDAKRELARRLLAYQEAVDRVTAAILAMPQWKARRLHKP
jgi:hypothetical protein